MAEHLIESAVKAEVNKTTHNFNRKDVVQIVNAVARKIMAQPGFSASGLKAELEHLLDTISTTRLEVGSAAPDGGRISEARDELDAVVEATEAASGKIMDACERIQALADTAADPALRDGLYAQTTAIFEACTFQDITGQRINKVIRAFKEIEKSVSGLLARPEVSRAAKVAPVTPADAASIDVTKIRDEDLLNGPQMPDNAISQEDIDRLLAEFE